MTYLRMLALGALGATALSFVSACTSVPVDPCSRAGIEYRLNQSLKAFASDNRADINDIRKASEFIGGKTAYGAMELAFAVNSLKRLVDSFREDVVPEIQSISGQCGTTENIQDVFMEFLRDEGVDREVLDWVNAMSSLLETGMETDKRS